MEEIQDGGCDLALLAGVPGVLHRQQLLRLQPLLQVVYQLLACSSTLTRLGFLLTVALSVLTGTHSQCMVFWWLPQTQNRGLGAELTKGDIEPAGQELQQPGKAPQEGELQLVVVSQIDQYRPQARLQSMQSLSAEGQLYPMCDSIACFKCADCAFNASPEYPN